MSDSSRPPAIREVRGSDGPPSAASLRPPAPGSAVVPFEDRVPGTAVFVVTYADETYAFGEGSWGRFGRDDIRCQIPVWEEINRRRLSRLAGELWCADGDLWLRNLSTSHELALTGATGAPQWLPRRLEDERGPACSVAGRFARIVAPSTGPWEILVERVTTSVDMPVADSTTRTVSMSAVPADLMPVAVALCTPILDRGDPPATYEQIAQSLDISRRQARRYVDRLCEHYAGMGVLPADDDPQGAGYARLAQLLVRRGRVTPEDVRSHRDPSAQGLGDGEHDASSS